VRESKEGDGTRRRRMKKARMKRKGTDTEE